MADRIIGGGKFKVGDRVNSRIELLEKYISRARDRHDELLQTIDELDDQISKMEEELENLHEHAFASLNDETWEL